jgi:hypothetical protein
MTDLLKQFSKMNDALYAGLDMLPDNFPWTEILDNFFCHKLASYLCEDVDCNLQLVDLTIDEKLTIKKTIGALYAKRIEAYIEEISLPKKKKAKKTKKQEK